MANTVIRLGYLSSGSGGGGSFLDYASLANFPLIGFDNVFYLALDTNKLYRWNGTG